MAEPVILKYRAFISYSHSDTSWAKWLHRALEGFRIDRDLAGHETALGVVPQSLKPIFRDRDEFTAGHALADQTLAALEASNALIVVCSPTSAKSRYVNEEIRLFKSRYPERPVIPLIVGGNPADPELECFAPALKFKLNADGQITDEPVELLAADAREEGDGKSLARAKVVAGLLGVSSDDVFRRAQRERRRRQQRWIVGLSAAALLLAGLAVWAEINRREAERNFEVAKQGASSLVSEIAEGLRDQEGMRTETVRKILEAAQQVIEKLVVKSNQNRDLLRLQAVMLRDFALVYETKGDITKQEESARKSLAIFERLAAADPDQPGPLYSVLLASLTVGDALAARGELKAALASYQHGGALAERLVKMDPNNVLAQRALPISYEKIGNVLRTQGKLEEALKFYQNSFAIFDRMAKADPSNTDSQLYVESSYAHLAQVFADLGRLRDALNSRQESLAIAERISRADPGNAEKQISLCTHQIFIADTQRWGRNYDDALKSLQECQAIVERLIKLDPTNSTFQRVLFDYEKHLGDVLWDQGDHDTEALMAYQSALSTSDRGAKADPYNTSWQIDLLQSYKRIGDLKQNKRKYTEALENYQKRLEIAKRLVEIDPANQKWHDAVRLARASVADMHEAQRTSVPDMLKAQGDAFKAQGDINGALKSYRAALAAIDDLIRTEPSNTKWQEARQKAILRIGGIAFPLVLNKDFEEALDAANQAISLLPDRLWLYTNRAHALMFLGRVDEARAIYLKYRAVSYLEDLGKSWQEDILADFEELRKRDLANPLMDEIESTFTQADASAPKQPD